MARHKSISQRLKYRLEPSVKQDIVNDWSKGQQDKFFDAYKQLEDAIGRNDVHETHIALDALKDIGIKSFDAIPNIAKALIDTPPDGNYD
ncbi:hypothetical protein [Psychrobacter namhaensis]|uniref:hypothetical protein n=1 Tax=Psychrobacter namhaensis TaxID=292734 RepID=UPI0018DF0631|nr:hypothetical protein [Psychrobacter namhaensis]